MDILCKHVTYRARDGTGRTMRCETKPRIRPPVTQQACRLTSCKLANGKEPKEARRPAPQNRYRGGALISPTAFEQARGGALGAGVEAGSGSLGAASSESAAGPRGAVGSGPAAVESAAVSAVAWWWARVCPCVSWLPPVTLFSEYCSN